ncbi:hypothetical protein QFC24_002671 [Naganishia onofrii]|uniref:Uncharacterized protein n=1 Tax=Naganishia onofrii TaxID=1851511 RepID=A0ACC2XPI4_9TREE|nr:hypothetical protein QFC24_002671 [Naganishia onofrii]
MDNKSTHSRTRRRPTRSRAPTEDASLTEDQATAEAGQGGVNVDSQSASRATSVSELTEPDMELRPAKRTRSKRDTPKEDVEMSRASSPLSADDGSMNGQIIDFHQSNASASGAPRDTSPVKSQDNEPPSTPLAPPSAYRSAMQEFSLRPANQSISIPPANHSGTPHNVFRPPPSAALAIFDRPPSPSFYDATQTVGSTSAQAPAVQVTQPPFNPFSSPGGSGGPKIKLSMSSLRATASPAPASAPIVTNGDESLHARHPRTSISVPQRTNSLVSTDTSPYAIGRVQKGKGKAKVNTSHLFDNTIPNHDYCAACKGIGSFLCCDGCPRSFHFMCLDPPLTINELPEDDKWYCKACRAARRPKSFSSPYTGMFAQLLQVLDDRNPQEFQLPEDIRTFFAGTRTNPDGSYGTAVEARPVKFDRAGFPEERDAYRLKSKGHIVLCYKCKGSAAPTGPDTAPGLAIGRSIVTCDYCPLSWHLDCLEPPAAIMPTSQRKWLCPNHAAQVLPKKRTLKNGIEVVTVNQPGQPNNGLIDVIDEEAERRRIAYQNMFINGKRYKVPEKIIQLDFWSKLGIKGATSSSETYRQ